jgi:tRNA A58 N-methylase Trm61
MKKLKHIGPGYHGGSADGTLVWAKTGDVVEVCDEKADQLFVDFPKEWVVVKAEEVVKAEDIRQKGKK